jgi:glycerophosphoryl diester phosphodiesterase
MIFRAFAIVVLIVWPAGRAAADMRPQMADKIIIAHRGASGYLPEHTLAAKALAHGQGAHFIEQDVVLTRDDVPIVLHDIHLDTVSDVAARFPDRKRDDGRYYAIDFTLAEIRTLNVHERISLKTGEPVFPARFPNGKSVFRVPTLAEELDLIQGLNASTKRIAGIYPEIKDPAFHRAEGKDISRIVIAMLADYGYRTKSDPIYLQSFDWNEVKRIRGELGYRGRLVQLLGENDWKIAPGVDFDYLKSAAGLAEIAATADGIGPWIGQVARAPEGGKPAATGLAAAAHENGLEVHPYTFRADALPKYAATLDELLQLFLVEIGVDGIFTDFPDLGLTFLRSR